MNTTALEQQQKRLVRASKTTKHPTQWEIWKSIQGLLKGRQEKALTYQKRQRTERRLKV